MALYVGLDFLERAALVIALAVASIGGVARLLGDKVLSGKRGSIVTGTMGVGIAAFLLVIVMDACWHGFE